MDGDKMGLLCEEIDRVSCQNESETVSRSHLAAKKIFEPNMNYDNNIYEPDPSPDNEKSNNDVINCISHSDPQIYDDILDAMGNSENLSLECEVENSENLFERNQCWLCDDNQSFREKDELIDHQLQVHSENVFCCTECDIVMYVKEAYDEHIALHDTLIVDNSINTSLNSNQESVVVNTDNEDLTHREQTVKCEFSMYSEDSNGERESTDLSRERIVNNTDEILLKHELSSKEMRNQSMSKRSVNNTIDINKVSCAEDIEYEYLQTEEFIQFEVDEKLNKNCVDVEYLNDYKIQVTNSCDVQRINTSTVIKNTKLKKNVLARQHICKLCYKVCPTKNKLIEHIRVHTKYKPFNCEFPGCNRQFRIQSALNSHVRFFHNELERRFVCQVEGCGRRFSSKSGFAGHLESHDPLNTYLCDTCGAKFKYKTSLIQHRKKKHSENAVQSFTCDHCNKTYYERYRLIEHMRLHINLKPFKCKKCLKEFYRSSQLYQHMQTHSTTSVFTCDICNKHFNRRGNMLAHVKRHSRSHRYTCLACNLPFDSLSDVALHRKATHTGIDFIRKPPKPRSSGNGFKCDMCDKLLATKITLQKHITNVHKTVKAWKCDLCELSFTAKHKLVNHRVIHSNMKPHPCQYCQDGYMTAEECLLHEQNHSQLERSKIKLNKSCAINSDIRPFVCSYCEKAFRRRDTMESHILIHKGIKPFQCRLTGCNRAFRQKGDRIVHERRVHNHPDQTEGFEFFLPDPNSAFTCLLCGLFFNNNDELTFHYELSHAEQLADGSDMIVIDSDALISFPEITVGEGNDEDLVLTDF